MVPFAVKKSRSGLGAVFTTKFAKGAAMGTTFLVLIESLVVLLGFP
jgi:hypothetical protein